eukprot:12888108-Prorocentrum_lima.AAC.1
MRLLEPGCLETFARRHDDMLLDALQDATDVNINEGWRAAAAWLPAPWGGLGLRSFARHTH